MSEERKKKRREEKSIPLKSYSENIVSEIGKEEEGKEEKKERKCV